MAAAAAFQQTASISVVNNGHKNDKFDQSWLR
jgi:hypothetical protein